MKLSTTELNLLRTYQHSIELKLSIFQPSTMMAARVNSGTITKGARTIPFDTVSIGSYLNVRPGMTCYVGTSAGLSNVGKVRVRQALSGSLVVAENSDILWANDLYLTVVNLFDIVPIFPRIIKDPSNDENVLFYKDYDIAYTNQNYHLGTSICMGPHRAVELVGAEPAQIYYSASGTENMGTENILYFWNFEGSTITGSNQQTPGYVPYSTPGSYLTTLTISGSSGSSDSSYRYIVIEPQGGTIKEWEIENLSDSRSSGGFTANITIREKLPFTLNDDSIVIIHTDEWYGSSNTRIGTGSEKCENIFAVGYILQDSIHYDYEAGYVEFEIGSVAEKMKQANGFAISAESKDVPSSWVEIRNLTVKKGIFHFLKWHSTALLTNDIQFFGTYDPVQFLDTSRESLFDGVQNYVKNTLQGSLISSMQGKLWIGPDISVVHQARTVRPASMTITKNDWIGTPGIQEATDNTISYLEAGGISYSGPITSISTPLLSAAPGTSPSRRGTPDSITGLVLSSQAMLNNLSGDLFAYKNARYPVIDLEMRTAFKNMQIAPQDTYRIIVNQEDTPRNIEINDLYTVEDVSWAYSSQNMTLMPTVSFRAVTEGNPGDTLEVPVEPPTAGYDIPDFDIPVFDVPSTDISVPGTEVPPTLPEVHGIFLVVLSDGMMWATENISEDVPVWISGSYGDLGVTGSYAAVLGDINKFGQVLSTNGADIVYGMYNGPKKIVARYEDFEADYPPIPPFAYTYVKVALGCDPNISDKWVIAQGYPYPASGGDIWKFDGHQFTKKYGVAGMGGRGRITHGNDNWCFTYLYYSDNSPVLNILKEDLSSSITAIVLADGLYSVSCNHSRAGLTGDTVFAGRRSILSNTYATKDTSAFEALERPSCAEFDPTGSLLMQSSDATKLVRSYDLGKTGEEITLPADNPTYTSLRIVNLGSPYNWAISYISDVTGITQLWITYDFGNTWYDKSAQLLPLIDTAFIHYMRYIP